MPQDYSFGMHLMLDLEACDSSILNDQAAVYDAMEAVRKDIGMTALTMPYVFPYDGGARPDWDGITGVTVIAESHITVHTFTQKRYVFVDVFSCTPFDAERATTLFAALFRTTRFQSQVVRRGLTFRAPHQSSASVS